MKNRELKWTREQSGLTQAAAADLMDVHRVTFAQWESGARPMPALKWQKFLKIAGVNPLAVPKFFAPTQDNVECPEPEKYDAKGYDAEGYNANGYGADGYDSDGYDVEGYPADFDRKPYAASVTHFWDEEAEAKALKKFEAGDYKVREKERYRLRETCGNPRLGIPALGTALAARFMAEYDEEQRRLSVGRPPRSYYGVHRSLKLSGLLDERGYPVGFYRDLYGRDYPEGEPDDDAGWEEFDAALKEWRVTFTMCVRVNGSDCAS
jgi:transcriptional regulator with XRE-family HTH domain